MSNEIETENLKLVETQKKNRGKAIVRYCEGKEILYNPRFCEALVEYMAEGKSFASFAGAIGVGESTISGWVTKNPEFKNAKEIAVLASLGKWEDIALRQAQGFCKGNASALIFTLKNRFQEHYRDKQEIDHGGELTFLFNTGISRDIKEVEKAYEAEFKVIDESEADSDLL